MSRELEGRIALISGAGRGQGAAEARLFAREGARVAVADIRDDEGAAVVSALEAEGCEAIYLHLDVRDADDWDRAVAEVRRTYGGLHVLVNNAGILNRAGIMQTTPEEWRTVVGTNLDGVYLGMRAAAPAIRDSGGGAIVNISSIAGLMGVNAAAYSASKWGVRGLTKVAALEFAPWGIRVNSVHPGLVDTPMTEAIVGVASSATPLGGRAARPEEIAELVLFLAGDRSSYVSGAEIAIDGARTAGLVPSTPRPQPTT